MDCCVIQVGPAGGKAGPSMPKETNNCLILQLKQAVINGHNAEAAENFLAAEYRKEGFSRAIDFD